MKRFNLAWFEFLCLSLRCDVAGDLLVCLALLSPGSSIGTHSIEGDHVVYVHVLNSKGDFAARTLIFSTVFRGNFNDRMEFVFYRCLDEKTHSTRRVALETQIVGAVTFTWVRE